MQGLPVRTPVVQRNVVAHVATGPRPATGGAAGGAAKPVQINLRDEGFDGMFQELGCETGQACSSAAASITFISIKLIVMHWFCSVLCTGRASAAAGVTVAAAVAAIQPNRQLWPTARPQTAYQRLNDVSRCSSTPSAISQQLAACALSRNAHTYSTIYPTAHFLVRFPRFYSQCACGIPSLLLLSCRPHQGSVHHHQP